MIDAESIASCWLSTAKTKGIEACATQVRDDVAQAEDSNVALYKSAFALLQYKDFLGVDERRQLLSFISSNRGQELVSTRSHSERARNLQLDKEGLEKQMILLAEVEEYEKACDELRTEKACLEELIEKLQIELDEILGEATHDT